MNRFELDPDLSLDAVPVMKEPACGGRLQKARQALGEGNLGQAQYLLLEAASAGSRDAAFLNMVGVVHEAQGHHRTAHGLYRQALISDPEYSPAWQNYWRLSQRQLMGDRKL